jgi:YbgC/YbaW family acyl-CoA thioester hydrolase
MEKIVPFKFQHIIRVDDTAASGTIYFTNQFKFSHQAMEALLESEGFHFSKLFTDTNYAISIIHASADYKASLIVGDIITLFVIVKHIGTSSFSFGYEIYKFENIHVGTVKTVHVTLNKKTRQKISIPSPLITCLKKYLEVK